MNIYIAVVILFFILLRVPKVRELETRLFQRLAGKILGQASVSTVMLLDRSEGYFAPLL